ncbi:MAG: DUF2249 domain-containing protein [Steroidobacteraceae bacterium]
MTEPFHATIDVRTIVPHERHALIFSTFASLPAGGALQLVNDHDPRPLRQQFQSNYHGQFSWDYLEQGPATWRVRIGRTKGNCCGSCGG